MSSISAYTFKVDVTPPVGSYLTGGFHWRQKAVAVESPLFLRGTILADGNGGRFVVAAIDYCYLCGRSQQRFVDAMA
jgi:hypothetical protein